MSISTQLLEYAAYQELLKAHMNLGKLRLWTASTVLRHFSTLFHPRQCTMRCSQVLETVAAARP